MTYQPSSEQYKQMQYRKRGNSRLKLAALALGFWHNLGNVNNYGSPPGSAEENLGRILNRIFPVTEMYSLLKRN